MSSEDGNEYKKLKSQYGVSSSSDEDKSSEYDGESSKSSYVLISEDGLLSEESNSAIEEQNYFESSSSEEDSEKSEVAWEDSDDNNDLREEMTEESSWLTSTGVQKKIKIETKKICFKLKRRVFTANCKVKIFKVFPEIKVLVDSFNLIYLIKSFDDFKTYKIDFFKISEICYFDGKILFSSNSSSFIKQMSTSGKVTDIKKGTGNIKKMVAAAALYVLGDKLFCFNKNISLVAQFNSTFIDFCVSELSVVCLKEDGDLYVFDLDLNFINKISFSFKFQFRSLYYAQDMFIVSTINGLMLLDKELKEIKTYSSLTEPISSLASNNDFIVHGSPYENSLRILKHSDKSYYERFPFSKIRTNPISTISIENDTFYISDSRFISSLTLTYKI